MDPSTGEGTPKDPGRRPKNSREVSGQSVVVVSHTQYLICFGRRGPTVSGFAGRVLVLVT